MHLTHTNLALIHLHRGAVDDATQALSTALHAFPDYAYARSIEAELEAGLDDVAKRYDFVSNDLLERFGEITTVVFE